MLRRRTQVTNNTRVPGGLIASTEKGDYLVKGDKRFKFVSSRARDSWNLKPVKTTEFAMSACKVAGVVGFRDGTLIRDISSHKIYLISDYKKRHVVSPDAFKNLGYSMKDVLLVSSKETVVHQEGEPLYR
jgi:hypothetical protein